MTSYTNLSHTVRNIVEAGIVSNPQAINTGYVKSGRNEYSSDPQDQQAGGHTAAMRRVADRERATKKEQEQSRDKMHDEIAKRQRAADKRQKELQSRVSEETNTEKREKVVNVAREDDAKPDSDKSKLAKNTEIKQKIIGEETPMFTRSNFGLSLDLINSVKSIVEKADTAKNVVDTDRVLSPSDARKMVGGKTKIDLAPKTVDKLGDDDNLDSGNGKKTKSVKEEVVKKSDDPLTDRNTREQPGRKTEIKKAIKDTYKKIFGEDAEQVDETWKYLQYPDAASASSAQKAHHAWRDENGMSCGNAARVIGSKVAYKGEFKGPKPTKTMNQEEVERIDEKKWIASAIKHPGSLHKQLHAPQDENIPTGKLAAAAEKGGKLGKRARLAQTLKKMHHEETDTVFTDEELMRIEEIAKAFDEQR